MTKKTTAPTTFKLDLTPTQLAAVREALETHLSILHHDRTDYELPAADDAKLASKEDVAFAILRAIDNATAR